VFPYNIFAYCSICRVDCKFARNKIKKKGLDMNIPVSTREAEFLATPYLLLEGRLSGCYKFRHRMVSSGALN
jgi:hypothetical protein